MGIINFSSSGGRKQIATYNSCVSNIQFTNKPDWISNPIENSGGLYIQVSANSSPSSRTCSDLEITYTSGEYNCSKTITIFQEGVSQQKTNPNLSWSESDKIITLGDQYELPTFNNPYQVTPITFSSNNSSVAQVNGTVGGNPNITINGPGSAVISANFLGNSDYLAQKVSYPLTVKKNSTNISWSQSVYNGTIGEDVSGLLSLDYPGDMDISNNRLYFWSSDNSYASFVNRYDLTSLVIKRATDIGVTIYADFTGDNKYSSTKAFCTLKIKNAELIDPVPFYWKFSSSGDNKFQAILGKTTVFPTLEYPVDLDTSRIYYLSSNSNVAGFTNSNTLSSLMLRNDGTATITAKFYGDDKYLYKEVSYKLLVNKEELRDPENFYWDGNDINITQGEENSVDASDLRLNKEADMNWSDIYFTYSGNLGVAKMNLNNGTIQLLGEVGTLTISATYEGDKYNKKTVGKTIHIASSNGEVKAESFDTIITKFNNSGIYSVKIEKGKASETVYDYLKAMYDSAKEEYYGNSPLFNVSNYSEIINYHGTNSQYELDGTAENAMYYWLMAMCLSELLVSKDGTHSQIERSSENSNTQTRLFKFGYDLGKESGYGRTINLYGNYTLKGDVNICRLVATVIYSKNRRYYKQKVSICRQIMGGMSIIPISNPSEPEKKWEETLGINGVGGDNCSIKDGKGLLKETVGYAVNLDNIFPAAAGPYATDYKIGSLSTLSCDSGTAVTRGNGVPWEQGQSESIFNLLDHNYIVDKAIYDEVCNNYNLNSNNLTIFRRTVQAIADACEKWPYLFGYRTYYTYNSTTPHDSFKAGTQSSPNFFTGVFNSEVLEQDLSLHADESNFTNIFYLASRAAKGNRKTILDPQYGRRRPGQGVADTSAYGGAGDVHNHLDDVSISRLAGGQTRYDSQGNDYYIDLNANDYKDSGEYYAGQGYNSANSVVASPLNATTYPSGHSSGIWAVAMMLIELLPSRYTQIYKAAYDFCISRTIVRDHWNSDIIYARLGTSTIIPILHAFTDFESVYSNAENIISGNTPIGGKGSAILIPNQGSGTTGDNTIDVTVINKSGSAKILDRKFAFTFKNGSFGVVPNNYVQGVSVADNAEFSLVKDYTPEVACYKEGATPLSGTQTVKFDDTANITLYSNVYGQSTDKDYVQRPDLYGEISPLIKDFPANTDFGLGRIYTIYLGGSDVSTVTLKSNSGNNGEGNSTIQITNNGTTDIKLFGRIRFIVSNNGNKRTSDKYLSFNNTSNRIILQPGSSCNATFVISSSDTNFGCNFVNPGTGIEVDGDTYYSNIILYEDVNDNFGNGQSLSPILPSLPTSSTYVNGIYSINIGRGTSPNPTPNENLFQPITIQIKVHNFSGTIATVNGIRFIVKSQDTNGYFHGLNDSSGSSYYNCGYGSNCSVYIEGNYNRVPQSAQSITGITIGDGQVSSEISVPTSWTETIYNAIGIKDGHSAVGTGTGGLGNRNPCHREKNSTLGGKVKDYGAMLYNGGNSYDQTIISPNIYTSKAQVLSSNYQFDRFQSGILYHVYILGPLQ